MATTPTPSDSTNDIYDAFVDAGTESTLAHRATENIRNLAGQNILAHMNARFDTFQANVDARFTKVDARFDVMDARFDGVEGQLKTLTTVINRDHLILLGIVATGVVGGIIAMLFR